MKKVALIVGLAASLGFSNAQAVELTWKGDVRYRYQSDLTDIPGVTGEHSRDRHRGRARLGVYAWINEELSSGVQIASGGPIVSGTGTNAETTSRNQTFDDAFHPDAVYLNEYFIDYHPTALNGNVNAILGKRAVANTLIIQNDLVWDSDLTFEGATLQYGKDGNGKEKDGLSAVVGYYPLNERSGTLTTGAGEQDAYLLVGQVAYKGEVSELGYQLGAGYYNYVNYDLNGIAIKSTANYVGKDFNIVEFFGSFGGQITETLPWQISGQYAFNAAKNSALYYNIDNSKRDSYLVEAKVGDAKQVGQWSLNADYVRIEQDALTQFTDSDRNLGSQVNLKGIKIGGVYHLVQNMTLGVNYFRFETIDDKNTPLVDESANTTHLFMADVVVKF